MNTLRLYLAIMAGLIILGIQPLIQSGTEALPAMLQRAFGEQQQLIADDGEAVDNFGWSVAIDGDTAVIGAAYDDVGANLLQGSAYVFVRSGNTWTQQAQLVADDGEANDNFGLAVALSGDTAIVGVPFDTIEGNSFQGSVYVFVRNGTTWTQQTQLLATDGTAGDYFGEKVSLDGDTALIGAPSDTVGANAFQGSAYVFVRSGTTWTQQQQLTANDGAAQDTFGSAVAVDGDTAVVGAYLDDVGASSDQGSAYAFVRSGTTWTQQQQLTAVDGVPGDHFGDSVALNGETTVIGSTNSDVNVNTDQGAAYVFVRSGTTWTQQDKLTADDGAANDHFGTSVSIQGDLAAVGAAYDNVGANVLQGSAYVFARSGTTWSQQTQVTGSQTGENDLFGFSVSLDASSLIVGAFGQDVETNSAQGAAYVYFDPELVVTETPTVTPTLEPGTTELVVNGGFENLGGDGKPDVTPWTIKNASGDKAKCNKDKDGDGIPDKIVAFAGNCAFQFKDVVGEAGKIQQNLDLSAIIPAAGDGITLSFYAESKGGATVKAKVVFKYDDDTKTKISVESSGAETYTEFIGSETLTSANVAKAKISVKSAQTSGKVYVDEISLLHTSAGLIAPPLSRLGSSTR